MDNLEGFVREGEESGEEGRGVGHEDEERWEGGSCGCEGWREEREEGLGGGWCE